MSDSHTMTKTKTGLDFVADDRIDHYVHGTGTIVEVTEQYTTIDFDEVGQKKFVTSMVKLTASDTPAPTKRKRTTKKKTTTKKAATKKTTTKKATTKKATAKKTTKKAATKKKTTKKD